MKSTKRNGQPPITAQDALQMLQSAIGYLQQAGVSVQAQNLPGGLTLTIPGACYMVNADGTAADFHIGTPDLSSIGT